MAGASIASSFALVGQRSGRTDDNSPDINADKNCLCANAAMQVRSLTGVFLRPEMYHDRFAQARGWQSPDDYTGFFDITDLIALFDSWKIPTSIHRPTDKGSAMSLIRHYLNAGLGLIYLKRFSPTDATPHFNSLVSWDGPDDYHTAHVGRVDPWSTVELQEPAPVVLEDGATFWSLVYQTPGIGTTFLGIDRSRDSNLI